MKFEHTQTYNIENALRGMRNPMDSWNKSDSYYSDDNFFIGNNDMALARKLIKAGNEHRKFLRQIFVSVDISAPRYWWAEFDTYKIGTVSNSCSTMHTLMKNEISLEMFELDQSFNDMNEYDRNFWVVVINQIERLRKEYNKVKDFKIFRRIKKYLPESFIQKRTVTMNYENILNMRYQRKSHRLFEWNDDFIFWSDSLPYIKEFEGV